MLVVSGSGMVLRDDDGRVLGRTGKVATAGVVVVGGYEVEVDESARQPSIRTQRVEGPAPGGPSRPVVSVLSVLSVPSGAPRNVAPRGALAPKPDAPAPRSAETPMVEPLERPLRPHQIEGVEFLHACLDRGHGALLADEMGLGKTLMTISVIWDRFRSKAVSKVLVACPVTLIDNWKKEFRKWLDMNRFGVLAFTKGKTTGDIVSFGRTKVYQVLIMGYEKILSCQEELSKVPFDLLVCDEGHRLKSSLNKVLKALERLDIPRKILLTGTPIQNDLTEFYNIINFINPGVLGTYAQFQKTFVVPIHRLRDVNCRNKDTIDRGTDASARLVLLTKSFILRRTASTIAAYLPAKTDYVVFAKPTKLQVELFEQILESRAFNTAMNNDTLALITLFKKLCNSPRLVQKDKLFVDLVGPADGLAQASAKVNVLIPMLVEFSKLEAKVVLVSNYTQTLDLLQEIVEKLNMSFLRLDGSAPNNVRDSLVTNFNKSPVQVFLLSAKSGGVGLNLVGAARLVLFDNDWNPLVDLQAMARIHRDGQRHPVFIYRILTTGCIDEKIFQRQLMKNNLSSTFLDGAQGANNVFDMDDLKDLFTIQKETASNTHDLLGCTCEGLGHTTVVEEEPESDDSPASSWMSALEYKDAGPVKKKVSMQHALAEYQHFTPGHDVGDAVLNAIMNKTRAVTYILRKHSPSPLPDSANDN